MRIAILSAAIVLMLVAQACAGIGSGTIETSLGGNFNLSPEPWELNADMYLVYYLNPMLGIGPFWELQKMGDVDVMVEPEQGDPFECTCKTKWHYRLGLFGKLYLPVTMAGGKLMPYVAGGAGIVSIPKPEAEWADPFEEETENKTGYFGELSFDYWVADSWTLWAGIRGSKVSGDEDTYFDMAGRDLTEFRTEILVGLSHFLMMD
jgi:hypothetical protein